MRIALVCPTYIRDRSYQENLWAEQLTRLGHAVRAFLPGTPHGAIEHVDRSGLKYERQLTVTRRLPRSTFWSGRVHELVRDFKPDLMVIFGDKTFSLRVVKDEAMAGVPVISTFSENLSMHEFDWRKKGISLRERTLALGFAVTRAMPIRAVCRRSTLIVGNTPQARDIILRLIAPSERPAIDAKMVDMPLGFSPDHFGFNPELRQRVRGELGIGGDEALVCVTSAFTEVKAPFIAMIVRALDEVMRKEPKLKAVIVGFSEKPEYAEVSKQIAAEIAARANAERFIKEPFAGRERLNELFNASDIAAFGRASISCQEALGTGLIGCFVDNGSLNHLLTAPEQGVLFDLNVEGDLADKLEQGVRIIQRHAGSAHEPFRRRLAQAAAWLGYDRIITGILDDVQRRARPHAPTSP